MTITTTTAEAAKLFTFAALIMLLSITGRVLYYGLTAKKIELVMNSLLK